jgi:hypothetical protein
MKAAKAWTRVQVDRLLEERMTSMNDTAVSLDGDARGSRVRRALVIAFLLLVGTIGRGRLIRGGLELDSGFRSCPPGRLRTFRIDSVATVSAASLTRSAKPIPFQSAAEL